jgi:hypothetical protein
LDGEGMKKYWTEKALSRIGFLVSEVKTNPYISVPAYGDINWHLISQNTCEDFPSLYDLVSRLSRTNELLTT